MGRTWEVLGDPGGSFNQERVNLGKFNLELNEMDYLFNREGM